VEPLGVGEQAPLDLRREQGPQPEQIELSSRSDGPTVAHQRRNAASSAKVTVTGWPDRALQYQFVGSEAPPGLPIVR
jgi:hypothetical protein